MSPRRINVVIDELHLRGLDRHQRERLMLGLEGELSRLFQSYPAYGRTGLVDHVTTPPVELNPRTSGTSLGAQVAGRIYGAAVKAGGKSGC
jgi:hypothetical protein